MGSNEKEHNEQENHNAGGEKSASHPPWTRGLQIFEGRGPEGEVEKLPKSGLGFGGLNSFNLGKHTEKIIWNRSGQRRKEENSVDFKARKVRQKGERGETRKSGPIFRGCVIRTPNEKSLWFKKKGRE